MDFDIIYRIYLLCAMENISSQDVGVSSYVEDTPTCPHFEDKNHLRIEKQFHADKVGWDKVGWEWGHICFSRFAWWLNIPCIVHEY